MRWLAGVCCAAVTALGAQGAGAVELLFENFNAEGGDPTSSTLNYNAFANFTVEDGNVDLIGTPNSFGLSGDVKYVDLDGSSTPGDGGYLLTRNSYAFAIGDLITLSFLASGNQRGGSGSDDNLFGGFQFLAPVSFSDVSLTGFTSFQTPTLELLGVRGPIDPATPYGVYSISFRAESAGALRALVGTGSADNVGPLLDNVRLTAVTPIPEPATWGLMILGLGGVGAALRARRRPALA